MLLLYYSGHKVISYIPIESDREVADVISAPIEHSDKTAQAGCRPSTTLCPVVVLARHPARAVLSLCSICADMKSATSLSLSIYNLLLYGQSSRVEALQEQEYVH